MNKVGVEEFRRCKKTGDAIVWEEIKKKKRRIRQYLMIVYCKLKIIKVFIFFC